MAMFPTRHELMERFTNPVFIPHPHYLKGVRTFSCLSGWQNYAHLRNQNELERECGVDINYLNLVFKREAGVTLYDHLVSVRLERAKHLLETTVTAVTDIAREVGYPNPNSFSRAFRRRENKSPLEFKRMSRADVLTR